MAGRIASEADLIATYLAPLTVNFPGAFNLTDDCASFPVAPGHDLVVTTDAVAAGVHFFPDDAAADVAWKALAVNVSDLAAKGARPLAYVMALSFPEAPERDWLESFAAGLGAAQAAFGIALIGGDTDRRPGPVSVTITAFGEVRTGTMVRRAGAAAGDAIFLTGTLGDSALGLLLRKAHGLAATWGLTPAEERHLSARYLRPEPRIAGRTALLDFATAAIDISDGFAKDLGHLVRASGVGAQIELAKLPLSTAATRALAADPALMTAIVAGGDDYEVLATVPRNAAAAFVQSAQTSGVRVTEIGEIEAGADLRLTVQDGRPLQLDQLGWQHF